MSRGAATHPVRARQPGVTLIPIKFETDGSGDTTDTGYGWSVAKTATGTYRVTLGEQYVSVDSVDGLAVGSVDGQYDVEYSKDAVSGSTPYVDVTTIRRRNALDLVKLAHGTFIHGDTTDTVSTADGTSEATAVVLANALKAAYNLHCASACSATTGEGAHLAADAANLVTSPDATNEATAITLVNELYTDYNTHVASATYHALPASATATNAATQFCGSVRYINPIAAELVTVVAALDPIADGALVIAAQPDYPRKLQVRIVDANSSVTAGTVTLVGVGIDGTAVGQTIDFGNGGTQTVITDDVYATITSATVASVVGAAAGDTIGIGVASALGLPIPSGAASVSITKSCVGSADEAVGTLDTTARSLIPTTVPNATNDYDFFFEYTLTPTQTAHTHAASASTHLASSTVASDAATLYTRLNDIKAKYNVHVASGLSDQAQNVVSGKVHMILALNATASRSAP